MGNPTDEQIEGTKVVSYMYSHAFLKCDCGKDLLLSQKAYGNRKYSGDCSCGINMELLDGKFRIHSVTSPPQPTQEPTQQP